MKRILGIDPALNHVGYGILFYNEIADKVEDVRYGIYDIDPKADTEDKLNTIFMTTRNIVRSYSISDVALEKVYHNPKMARGGFAVREAIGALKVAIIQENKAIYYYTPQKVKKDITGNGKADKLVMAKTVAKMLNIPYFEIYTRIQNKTVFMRLTPEELVRKKFDHISDAISIAFCRMLELKTKKRGQYDVVTKKK